MGLHHLGLCDAPKPFTYWRSRRRPSRHERIVAAVEAQLQGDAARARRAYDALIAERDDPMLRAQRAVLHAQQGRLNEAWDDLAVALDLDPDHPESLANRAALRALAGDDAGAYEDALDALAHLPNALGVRCNLAYIRVLRGDLLSGLGEADEVLRRDLGFAPAYLIKALALARLGRSAEAERCRKAFEAFFPEPLNLDVESAPAVRFLTYLVRPPQVNASTR